MWRFLIIAFLFGHGAIVAAQVIGVPDSWLFEQRKAVGVALTLAAGAPSSSPAPGSWRTPSGGASWP